MELDVKLHPEITIHYLWTLGTPPSFILLILSPLNISFYSSSSHLFLTPLMSSSYTFLTLTYLLPPTPTFS